MMCRLRLSIVVVSVLIVLVNSDYYSSTTGLEFLLDTESRMVETLEKYLQAEEFKATSLRRYLGDVEAELKNAKNNTETFYDNPINSFKTLKRLTRDWKDITDLSRELINEQEYETSLKAWNDRQPNLDDLIGAAKGLARLQQTYGLDTMDIADGTLMGVKASIEMQASECFDLGKSLLAANDAKNAASWLIEARVRLAQETKAKKVRDVSYLKDESILEHLNNATTQIGNSRLSLLLTGEKLKNDTNDLPPKEKWLQHSTKLTAERLARHRAFNKTKDVPLLTTEMYEKTCSGEFQQTPAEKRDLRCRYESNYVPFCLIAPFKLEELSLDPYVAYYHESIYESEIAQIFAAAEDNVVRSRVGTNMVSEVRTSKNTWLWYHEHEFLNNLAQRLVDMTGLSLDTAEALQVANYGIGGHYGPHYDFHEGDKIRELPDGNRIMTALFYINDVELGGATAFPYLNLAVEPIRRSLVMWYNLHESLELDYRTKHAGCPVIKGSKWICNEWFHSAAQEFYRPCNIVADGYKSTEFKNIK